MKRKLGVEGEAITSPSMQMDFLKIILKYTWFANFSLFILVPNLLQACAL